jgi:hypothetical protein
MQSTQMKISNVNDAKSASFVSFAVLNDSDVVASNDAGHVRLCGAFED